MDRNSGFDEPPPVQRMTHRVSDITDSLKSITSCRFVQLQHRYSVDFSKIATKNSDRELRIKNINVLRFALGWA